MKIHCTACCKEKSEWEGSIPSIERYLSPRIDSLFKLSRDKEIPFRILSGKFGLLRPEDAIEWYDKRLETAEIRKMLPLLKQQLQDQQISEVWFYATDSRTDPGGIPYSELISIACDELELSFVQKTYQEIPE